MIDNYEKVLSILNIPIRKCMSALNYQDRKNVQEIRLRINRPVAVSMFDIIRYISSDGKLTTTPLNSIIATKEDIEFTFKNVCQYSLHSFQKELSQGYITINGGNRIGLCGTAVIKNNEIETIKDISGINIRIAREIIGCSEGIYSCYFKDAIQNSLIIGPPSSGKTTVLRDLCRLLGEKNRVSVIDERNEISATVGGVPQNNIGISTDIFSGYGKAQGIMTALRVMSPQILVCDEIGNDDDAQALLNVSNCGVKIIATAHAGSIEEVMERKSLVQLFNIKAFELIIHLGSGKNLGQVIYIKRLVK